MRRGAFLRKYLLKFTVALTLVGLIVYTVYHAMGGSSGSLLTTPARRVSDTQILGGEAYLFRSETLLRVDGEGLVSDLTESGSKVGKDVALATVWTDYAGETLSATQKRLDRLNRTIAVLENGRPTAGESPLTCREEAERQLLLLRQAVETGKLDGVTEMEDAVLSDLIRYSELIGNENVVNETLTALRAERDALLTGNCHTVVNTLSSGYFYNRSYVDGGEEIFTAEALDALTVESFDDLRARYRDVDKSGFSVGKMVYGYQWRLAVGFDLSVDSLIAVDDTLRVVFPENRDLSLTLTCERILTDETGHSVAILCANETPKDFEYLRMQHVEIEVGVCNGYYIPEGALRVQDGVEGVFVFENSTVYFRRVEILYRGDGYCIAAEQGDRGNGYLALNDMIVTSGENLYDGRVYQ